MSFKITMFPAFKGIKNGIEDFSEELETIKRSSLEIVELRSVLNEVGNPVDGFNSRLDTAEERIGDIRSLERK